MKKVKFIIPVHSFIDVVTNSSTSIYVGCHDNTIRFTKDLIDKILKASGSVNRTAEDVFDFKLTASFDDEYECRLEDNLSEYFPDIDFEIIDEKEKERLAKELFNKMLSGEVEPYDGFGCDYEGDFDCRTLSIISKSGDVSIDLINEIEKIFCIEARYDG